MRKDNLTPYERERERIFYAIIKSALKRIVTKRVVASH